MIFSRYHGLRYVASCSCISCQHQRQLRMQTIKDCAPVRAVYRIPSSCHLRQCVCPLSWRDQRHHHRQPKATVKGLEPPVFSWFPPFKNQMYCSPVSASPVSPTCNWLVAESARCDRKAPCPWAVSNSASSAATASVKVVVPGAAPFTFVSK